MPSGVLRHVGMVALATLTGVGATACATGSPGPAGAARDATQNPISAPVRPAGHGGEPGPSWAYQGPAGPAFWSTLTPEFRSCGTGNRQSPIDLDEPNRRNAEAGEALVVDYRPVRVQLVNTGHTVQANVSTGSRILIGAHPYALRQFHFHLPSEHTVHHAHAPMELHLVHADADGALAVVAVLLTQQPGDSVLSEVLADAPGETGATRDVLEELDPTALLPPGRDRYVYTGSLTTPPCTEGVRWAVLTERSPVTVEEVAAYGKLFPKSNRPIQPRRGRQITLVTSRQGRS